MMSNSDNLYRVYSGVGTAIKMIYRVHKTSGLVEYCITNYWAWSGCTESHIRKEFPLVAKNVRFK